MCLTVKNLGGIIEQSNKERFMSIKDYSKIENFNLAAIKAVRENTAEKTIKNNHVCITYKYKGRVLEVKARVVVWGYMDGEVLLDNVDVISVEQVKGGYDD